MLRIEDSSSATATVVSAAAATAAANDKNIHLRTSRHDKITIRMERMNFKITVQRHVAAQRRLERPGEIILITDYDDS